MRREIAMAFLLGAALAAGCGGEVDGEQVTGDDMVWDAESVLSMNQVLRLARTAGLPCGKLVTAGAIAVAESGLNTHAVYVNPGGSRDRGLWQINSYWHREVSDACAFNAACNARAMVRISSHGSSWQPWSTYNSGAYRSHVSRSQQGYHQGVPGCS